MDDRFWNENDSDRVEQELAVYRADDPTAAVYAASSDVISQSWRSPAAASFALGYLPAVLSSISLGSRSV